MRCPLCHAVLPDDATQCTYCDWARATLPPSHRMDWTAAILSFVPGLGHLYKGHLLPGVLLLCLLGPLYLAFVFWLVPKTYGASLLLPAFFVFVTGRRAYHLPRIPSTEMGEHATRTLQRWQARLHARKP